MKNSQSHNTAELAAFYYLLIPVVIFFTGFVKPELSFVSTACIFYFIYLITISTKINFHSGYLTQLAYFLFISIVIILLSGTGNIFYRNIDWVKHFAVINHLIDNDWPTKFNGVNNENLTLRYTIGWYLPSALILKIGHWKLQDLALSIWSAAGLITFFFLIKNFISKKSGWLIAPILFILFSGMDFLGGIVFKLFSRPVDITWWNGAHIEWWSGWMSYSSIVSLLFWTPQHAIPAWIATALIMQQFKTGNNLQYLTLIISCVMLTSPFTVIGLLPFAICLMMKYGVKKLIFNWHSVLSIFLIAIPLASYLTAFTADIPYGFIWNKYCRPAATGCFSFKSYGLIMLMEVIPFVVLLFIAEKQWRLFIIAAGLFLIFLPFVHMGLYNDIVMRASIPAISFIAILSAKVILDKKSHISLMLFILLFIGSFTPTGEIIRAITWPNRLSDQTTFDEMPDLPVLYPQYFAPNKIWILDSP